ncbi:hypothetical protein [Paenibacillus sp. FSL H3-0333]|uniref:hypothetical protein n=1 Tax=Paenibacillus sp. FSL H3-0333 TaxID=2921373 RepID=UPI0030FA6A02
MSRITIKEYRAANGGDYDFYKLSDGRIYWLWFKSPFRGTEGAVVHLMTNNPTKEVGLCFIEKTNCGIVKMGLKGKSIEVPITLSQEVRPNKKYFLDKIVRNFLINE